MYVMSISLCFLYFTYCFKSTVSQKVFLFLTIPSFIICTRWSKGNKKEFDGKDWWFSWRFPLNMETYWTKINPSNALGRSSGLNVLSVQFMIVSMKYISKVISICLLNRKCICKDVSFPLHQSDSSIMNLKRPL